MNKIESAQRFYHELSRALHFILLASAQSEFVEENEYAVKEQVIRLARVSR